MKRFISLLAVVLALASPASAAVKVVLPGVTTTTSTSAAVGASGGPVDTGAARYAGAMVWSAAGGTYTVLLEEQASSITSATAPWVLVATMANCDASGSGTVTPASTGTPATATCGFSTLTPASRTRLRVSARSSGTIYGVIWDAR